MNVMGLIQQKREKITAKNVQHDLEDISLRGSSPPLQKKGNLHIDSLGDHLKD